MKKPDKHFAIFTAEEVAEIGLRIAAGTTNAAEAAAEAGFEYVTGNATVWIDDPNAFLKLIENTFPELIIAMLRQRLEEKNITIHELVSILAQAKAQQASVALPALEEPAEPEELVHILDQACFEWVNRKIAGHLGRYTQQDFLDDFGDKTGQFISRDVFRRHLTEYNKKKV